MEPILEEKQRLRSLVWDRANGRCTYCGKDCKWSGIRVTGKDDWDFGLLEHVIPRSKGGSWDIENLVLSCKYCNLKKAIQNGEKFCWKPGFGGNVEMIMRIVGIRL